MKTYQEYAGSLIRHFEGLKLESYVCPAGKLTIGYGHAFDDVFKGQKITKDEAEKILEKDIEFFNSGIKRYLKVPLAPNQLGALISFAFNVGIGNLKTSTLLRKINLKDFDGASKEFLRWNKATVDGKLTVLDGLTKRREAESQVFLKG